MLCEEVQLTLGRATCPTPPKTGTQRRQLTSLTNISPEDEATLVARVKAGDQSAFARLVALFGPRMKAVAHRFLRCEDDCNDAVQDAFIRAFKSIARFEANSRLSTWLHRITVNSCLMKLRLDSSRKETAMDERLPSLKSRGRQSRLPGGISDPSTIAETGELCVVVRQAIEKLPERYRMVILLRDIEENNTAATAAILATTENNVKHRLRRAQALGTLLDPTMNGKASLPSVM